MSRLHDHESNVDSAGMSSDEAILEQNVGKLLTQAHQPPAMDNEARDRVLARLKAQVRDAADSADDAERAAPSWAWRLGLAGVGAVAFAALVFALWRAGDGRKKPGDEGALAEQRQFHNPGPAPMAVKLADGSELIINRATEVEVTGRVGSTVLLERGAPGSAWAPWLALTLESERVRVQDPSPAGRRFYRAWATTP